MQESENEHNFFEAVQNAQLQELYAKVQRLENMIDDLANQIILQRETV